MCKTVTHTPPSLALTLSGDKQTAPDFARRLEDREPAVQGLVGHAKEASRMGELCPLGKGNHEGYVPFYSRKFFLSSVWEINWRR